MATPPVLMNDFARQWQDAGNQALEAVRVVGESAWYILGKQVAAFETQLATEIGIEHVVGCANGLDAIEMGLRALDLKPGQKVLTTPLSAFATSLAIVRAGGVPVFVDVDDTGLIDLDLVGQALAADRSIRFMVPVHLFGQALDLGRLGELVERFEIDVIEDACQAIGARSRGRAVGSVGKLGSLSFYPTKNLGALGDGGAVITKDAQLATRCRALRDYGQTAKYVHEIAGLNSRLDELHAAILAKAFLPKLAAWTARRREVARQYNANIQNPAVTVLPTPAGSESVWHLFPLRVAPEQRAAFMSHLQVQGVQSGVHYPMLISDQAALAGTGFQVLGALDRARALTKAEVSIPIHPYLLDAEISRVVDAVNSFRAA